MRASQSFQVIALATVLASLAIATADDDPIDEKNWRNEKTWPAFVAARYLKAGEADDRLTKLLKERFNAAQQELRSRYVYWLQNEESFAQVCDAARRVVEARLEAGGPGSDRMEILNEKLAFAKVSEKQAEKLARKFNRASQQSDLECAAYFRASAELDVLRAENAAAKSQNK